MKECHGGGIRVTMITGDHKITAAAIARMLGIGDGKTAITGAEIEEMDTATLQERVRDVDVFARASPEHKLRLVKAIQANRQIVAMTGDGVNDAPALKKADIGVAMGIKGTEVTKEAAEMILADDNFASITAAVKEGRTVYNNIEKAILFMLPTNVAQALVIAVAIFFGFTMPITAPQVLWVNMVTSVALGLVISFEPHETRRDGSAAARGRPPDPDRLRHLARRLRRPGAARLYAAGVLLDEVAGRLGPARPDGRSQRHHHRSGLLPAEQPLPARLVAVAQGASRQRYLPLGIGAVVVLQLLFTYAPPLQACSATKRSRSGSGRGCLLGGLVFFLVVEAEKLIIRSSGALRSAVTAVEAGT